MNLYRFFHQLRSLRLPSCWGAIVSLSNNSMVSQTTTMFSTANQLINNQSINGNTEHEQANHDLMNHGLTQVTDLLSSELLNLNLMNLANAGILNAFSNDANMSPVQLTAQMLHLFSTNVDMSAQMLQLCAPLLKLAIKQTLTDCLPSNAQFTLNGQIQLCVHDANIPAPNDDSNSNENDNSHRVVITFDEQPLPNNTVEAGAMNSSSRRKSLHPNKCFAHEKAVDNYTSQTVKSAMQQQQQQQLYSDSAPTSPSTDSGVLDLSRSGSLAGSAPITPMKNPTIEAINQDQSLINNYQRQFMLFNQLQNAWRLNLFPTSPGQQHATSMPNDMNISPPLHEIKPQSNEINYAGRRTGRTLSATGRLTTLRRANSNRRFPCNQCREEFNSLHTLEQHTLGQHGTYRCHICHAEFTQRSNLQRHALKHVGFKPFECRVCSKAYYRKDHLMRHMEMGHPGFIPRENITVHLTSSESLEYLSKSNQQANIKFPNMASSMEVDECPNSNESNTLNTNNSNNNTMVSASSSPPSPVTSTNDPGNGPATMHLPELPGSVDYEQT